ncbi:pregnancy-specific glycoprotein 28, partial [Sigmodon hispidus]
SILTCWHLPTTAEVTIELVPPHVVEGINVLLNVHNLPENLLAFAWYRSGTNMNHGIAIYGFHKELRALGLQYRGTETVFTNGSLMLPHVTCKFTGFYTLRTISKNGEIVSTTTVFLYVH